MNAITTLWIQILLVATVLSFIYAPTKRTPWKLGFPPRLGYPWFELFGWPFRWWFTDDAYAHVISVTDGFIAGLARPPLRGRSGQAHQMFSYQSRVDGKR